MRTLAGMKDKKIVRLIRQLEVALEKEEYELADFVLQEAAMAHLSKRGWKIEYCEGILSIQQNNWGGASGGK